MRRGWWGALVVLVAVWLGSAVPSAAGGGSTFSFPGQWFAPGQVAVGRTQFSDWVGAQGRVADGPYLAYLVPGDRFIEPPRLPLHAIRLGQVKMIHVEGTTWKASIRFLVPNVRPGRYTISMCNVPCRNAYAGDLMGAWIFVAASAEQAKMKNLETRISDRVMEGMSDQLSDMSEQLEQLREAVGAAPPSGITVGTELRLTPIEAQLKHLSGEVRELRGRADQGLPAWLWLAGWVVAGAIGAAWWRSRRRPLQLAGRMPGGSVTTQNSFPSGSAITRYPRASLQNGASFPGSEQSRTNTRRTRSSS